ncbi:MAG: MFS transporter [Abditibacteriota bacterium]|nr:MFS transporter [Abditibacteriota bacterium]
MIEKYYKRNFFILALCIVFASMSYQIIMPFLPRYLGEMSLTAQQVSFWTGLIFSCQAVAVMIANPIWGKVGDTYGRKIMILRAGTVISLMFVALYFCTHPYQILIVRFINGFFTGFIPASIALISTNTPPDKVLKYVASAQSFMAFGQLIGPSVGGLLSSAVGFRNTCLISFGLVAFITLMVLFFVKEINKPDRNEKKTNIFQDLKEIVGYKDQKLLLFVCIICGVTQQAVMPFVVIHLSNISSVPDWVMGVIYAFPAIGMILSAQFWTRKGNAMGFVKVLTFSVIALGIVVFLFGIFSNIIWFSILFFVFGLFMAAMMTNITARTVAAVEADHRGRVLSVQDSFKTLGHALAPITVGTIAKSYGTSVGYMVMGVFIIVASTLVLNILRKK